MAIKEKTAKTDISSYYATLAYLVGEKMMDILEFASEQARDDWVNFEDIFSKDMKITFSNCLNIRIPLTEKQALFFIGQHRDVKKVQYEDGSIYHYIR